MEHVLFKDVLPYIEIWTSTILLILLVLACHLWRFRKKHSEIFKDDNARQDKKLSLQKSELQRQYNNKSMVSLSLIFIWVIGIIAICFCFDSSVLTIQGWGIVILAFCGILWTLSLIERKPQNPH